MIYFYIVKFNYFSERPNKAGEKDILKYFLLDHCAGNIGNKNVAGKYLKNLVSVSPSLY